MITSDELADIYRDLHLHPELSYQETRTAGIVADYLTQWGYEVTTGIGGTGVVGILRNGDGGTAMLRADMDALPVAEETGLPYASTATATDDSGNTVPVMHACGHDIHVTCLLGAASRLAAERDTWSGTLVLVFQQGEERAGALRMVEGGLADIVPKPDVVLGQHVAPMPVGVIGLRPGPAFAASDQITIVLRGKGTHGSRPEAGVDPIVMAAALVLRLQTIPSREVSATSDPVVVTVGRIEAGLKGNIIPDTATLELNVRTYSEHIRAKVLASIVRMAKAEAQSAGAELEPLIDISTEAFPVLVNDPAACERTRAALAASPAFVIDPGPVTGSEDAGVLATAVGAPLVYWLLGGMDPALFEGAMSVEAISERIAELPANHSAEFAPVIEPTLTNGINALVTAAREWLPNT